MNIKHKPSRILITRAILSRPLWIIVSELNEVGTAGTAQGCRIAGSQDRGGKQLQWEIASSIHEITAVALILT
jgi:hypothetical protein